MQIAIQWLSQYNGKSPQTDLDPIFSPGCTSPSGFLYAAAALRPLCSGLAKPSFQTRNCSSLHYLPSPAAVQDFGVLAERISKIAARKAVGLCLLDVLTQPPPPLPSDYRLCLTFAEGVGGVDGSCY